MTSPWRAAGAVPFWLWPWCAFLFLLPFKQVIAGPIFPLLEFAGAVLIALSPRPRAPLAVGRFLAISALTLVLCLSYFGSVAPEASEDGLSRIFMAYFAYLCLTSVRLKLAELHQTMGAWLAGGATAATLALFGYAQGRTTEDGRAVLLAFGHGTDPNYFAAELLIPFGIGLYFAREPARRWWALPMLAIIGLEIALTQSRGGLLAGLVLLGAWLAFYGRWKLFAIAAACISCLYLAFAASLGRLNLAEDPSGSHRTTIWLILLPIAVQHMATGVGLDASATITANASGFYRPLGAHNTYVQAFVEAGLPGLLALIAVLATHMRPVTRPTRFPELHASLYGLAVAALFLQCLSYQLLWIPWILIAQAAILDRPEPTTSPVAPPAPRPLIGTGDHYVYLAKD